MFDYPLWASQVAAFTWRRRSVPRTVLWEGNAKMLGTWHQSICWMGWESEATWKSMNKLKVFFLTWVFSSVGVSEATSLMVWQHLEVWEVLVPKSSARRSVFSTCTAQTPNIQIPIWMSYAASPSQEVNSTIVNILNHVTLRQWWHQAIYFVGDIRPLESFPL